ncbi:hypothetical protein HK104_005606 [Borealophlyctis nickersoniae]|nr:hypothetical protein HK104_005606 [Borealophlyctis nickersoniae]
MASNGSLRNVGGSGTLPKFGLILKNKTKQPQKPAAGGGGAGATKLSFTKKLKKPSNALGLDEDSDDDDRDADGDTPISDFSAGSGGGRGSTADQRRVNKELRAVHAQKARQAEEEHRKALEEDPTVFDYDGVYDELKKAEEAKKRGRDNPEGEARKKKPRYMEGLMKASAQRKLDLERAEERKAQREREAEGEEFGDKERFVTQAYKERQAELRRLEEEEKRREEMEGDATKTGDLTGFYREILNKTERSPIVIPAKSSEPASKEPSPEPDVDEIRKREAIRLGVVQLNDSEELVDKRQLLAGGLNITARTLKQQREEKEAREREEAEYRAKKAAEEEERKREAEKRRAAKEQQARSRELILKQQRELEEEEKKKKEREKEELVKKLARQTNETTVMDARARYLARKKAQEAARGGEE